jgi:integrase
MTDMKLEAVPHGFRSTFKDWASERTNYPNELTELVLAHAVADQTEAAYRRGDMYEKRVLLMQDWADYCNGG